MLKEAIAKMPQAFQTQVLLRGQDYFEKGQVLNIRLSDGLLKGRVKGSSSQIYDVHMDLKTWPSKAARCTCPVQLNCKHAAACLFALRDREQANFSPEQNNRLDRRLDVWLKNLRAQEAQTKEQQRASHHLVYLISFKLKGYEHKVSIQLALAKLLKRGGYGRIATFNSLTESKKQHFIANDNEIVAQLMFKCDAYGWFDAFSIRNSELLEQIIATGRAFLQEDDSDPLVLGKPKNGECEWVLSPDGNQNLVVMAGKTKLSPLLLDDSWYIHLEEKTIGRLHTPYPVQQLAYLMDAPPIPIDQAELLAKKMQITCPGFPVPKVFDKRQLIEQKPSPILILDAFCNDTDDLLISEEDQDYVFFAEINFDYSGNTVAYPDPSEHVVSLKNDVLLEYKRDKDYEHSLVDVLSQHLSLEPSQFIEQMNWGIPEGSVFVLKQVKHPAELDFLYNHTIPQLKKMGWTIEFLSPLYQEVVTADDVEWFSELQENGNQFFSYQLGILVEGQPVSIVPLVAELIQRYHGESLDSLPDTQLIKLPLKDGRALQVEMGRIKPLVRLLLQFGMRHIDENEELKLTKYQLILMQEAELAISAIKSRWQGADYYREELRQLIHLTQIPAVTPPKGLKASLREYQQFGLNWLKLMRASSFSGVLADDMGLGKTVQTLAHLQYEKEQGRLTQASLIIAPTSLVGNWYAEAQRFTPELKVLVYHGSDRHQDSFDGYDLVVSTYGLIHRDKEKFVDYLFYYLILDEAQFIKNARTKTTQVIQQLKASHRLCLTGTPLENHLGELWSLFHFLMPGLLGDSKQFGQWFRTPIEKYADLERRELLAQRVKPFMLRRTKNEVAKELPPKTEMTRMIDIVGPQRDLYEAIRMSMEKKVRDAIAKQGLGKSHILLLDALLKLRQVCCDPKLLSFPEAEIAHGSSSKLDALMELLDNLVGEGRRVLVFSQFTSMLKLIEEKLQEKQYPYLKLTGQSQNRQALVETFQEGNIPIFLISLKAGGTGLNLTRADTVIHYDPWWNPAVEDQATDRTHRIGQENPVFVYKLITAGTVEEAILGMQERKRQLVDGILSSDATKTLSLTADDLDRFFMPLTD